MNDERIRIDVRAVQEVQHRNDCRLMLEVAHPAGARWVATFDGDRIVGSPDENDRRLTLFEIDFRDTQHRFGLTPMQLIEEPGGRTIEVTIDFLARTHQAERFAPIIDAVADSAFAALLARGGHEAPDGALGPERWSNVAQWLHEAVILLASAPPKRLREGWGEWGDDPLDGRALTALALRPHALVPSPPGAGSIPLRGRHYRVGTLHTAVLRESHDTPEVRFMHTVLRAAIRDAETAVRRARAAIDRVGIGPQLAPHLNGYETIRTFHRHRLRNRARERMERIAGALASLHATRALAHRHLPLPHGGAPSLEGARSHDPRIQRVRAAHDVLRSDGEVRDDAPQLIAAIRSLSTVYEIFALSELDAALLRLGCQRLGSEHDPRAGSYGGPPRTPSGEPFPNRFRYHHPQVGALTLHYEPRIRPEPHPTARLRKVARGSEFLTPDFVLTGERFVLIMDAKTGSLEDRGGDRDAELAKQTLKYLHGLHPSGSAPIVGLLLLHLTPYGAAESYHDALVMPTLRRVPVHPRVDHLTATLNDVLQGVLADAPSAP